jgi:quercetin dioxygenase-like cupin family protein
MWMERVVVTSANTSGAHSLIIGPDEGAVVPGADMVHKVGASHLTGSLLIMEGVIRPGQLIAPHTHTREDECAYVLSGQLTYQIGDLVRTVSAGTYVVKPRGIPHAFWNGGSEPARVMELHLPATFDRFYDEGARIFAAYGVGDPEGQRAFSELSERYGLVQHWERVAEITARYGLGRRP